MTEDHVFRIVRSARFPGGLTLEEVSHRYRLLQAAAYVTLVEQQHTDTQFPANERGTVNQFAVLTMQEIEEVLNERARESVGIDER